jgi:hypothetical protein
MCEKENELQKEEQEGESGVGDKLTAVKGSRKKRVHGKSGPNG